MIRTFEIDKLHCLCSTPRSKSRIAYILYPADMLADWVEPASEMYDVTIVVVTGMDWQNVFSPWPSPGVPAGTPDFEGKSPDFLRLLQQTLIPQIEKALMVNSDIERSLVGVSMSGLFALWQWMIADTFTNIASLSGSFWYEGFLAWMKAQIIPPKTGKAFFLLGDQESKSNVKAFNSVPENTHEILALLQTAGIDATFKSVPGNHFSDPIPRLDQAFRALYL